MFEVFGGIGPLIFNWPPFWTLKIPYNELAFLNDFDVYMAQTQVGPINDVE